MPRAHRTNAVSVADVFSVDLYTGTGAAQTITTGINLSGNGGLVWIKSRTEASNHGLTDTVNGATTQLRLNSAAALDTSDTQGLTAFSSSGYTVGTGTARNFSGATYVSWTFRKAAKFFDVVTYTGDGTGNRQIAHSLGAAPGMVITKSTNAAGSSNVIHRSNGAYGVIKLNSTVASVELSLNNLTSTTFRVDGNYDATYDSYMSNRDGENYVAYLFAHDSAGVIDCASYTGNGSATGPTVTLGWQPQFLMIKRTDSTGDWWIYDSARSTSNPRINKLLAQASAVEDTAGEDVDFNATSFQLKSTAAGINASGGTYIYMAIKAE